jgi:hypothetical protein
MKVLSLFGLVLVIGFTLSCEEKPLVQSAHNDDIIIEVNVPESDDKQDISKTKLSDLIAQEMDLYGEDSSSCPKLEKNKKYRIESLRTYYCHFNILSLKSFETLFSAKLFKNRQEINDDFFNHKNSFAVYNPKFINGLRRFISNIEDDSALHRLISLFYEKHIFNWIHLNFLVLNSIKENPSWIREEIQFYQLLTKNDQDIRARMMFYRDFLDPQYFAEKKLPNPNFKNQTIYEQKIIAEVVAFWVRRHIKEQDNLFESLLSEFIKKFSPEAPQVLTQWKKSERSRFDSHRALRRETFKRQMKRARLPASQLDLETFENIPIGEDEQL